MRKHFIRTIQTNANNQQQTPTLSELEKLRPTRLTKYLPASNPLWYIEQIHQTTRRLNRAFSKQQLIEISKQLKNNNQQQQTKQSIISHILFNHWQLTNPVDIPKDQSFQALVGKFKSNSESYVLPYHELFLLKLEQKRNPKQNLIQSWASKSRVDVQISPHQEELSIFGHMKDREAFWTEFLRNRRPVHSLEIVTPTRRRPPPALLTHLSELANCSLEHKDSTEYDRIPILIDMPAPANDTKAEERRVVFKPFSYPFELAWPHSVNFDGNNLSRLACPSGKKISQQDETHHAPLDGLLSSTFPVLTGLGHHLTSRRPDAPLLMGPFQRLSTDGDEKVMVEELRAFWIGHFPPAGPTPQFLFLKASPRVDYFAGVFGRRHPMQSDMNEKDADEIAEEEELETQVYLPFKEAPQEADEGCSISYEVVHKRKKKVSTPLPESVDQDDDGVSKEVWKVWRKRLIILRPDQSNDLMVQVEKRERLSEREAEMQGLDDSAEAEDGRSDLVERLGTLDDAEQAQLVLVRRLVSLRRCSPPFDGRTLQVKMLKFHA
ncbi:uncharacterized protein VP01_987g4 [Puccinia sorghi]|uniref:Uncharacterized protein n=1 Tax=Puccinia sorghi TaxID=27349 RepID=A0A0L6U5I3_9BASI|nr:uncharacterized protein VP01_987g4 [Puccinia sorghi]